MFWHFSMQTQVRVGGHLTFHPGLVTPSHGDWKDPRSRPAGRLAKAEKLCLRNMALRNGTGIVAFSMLIQGHWSSIPIPGFQFWVWFQMPTLNEHSFLRANTPVLFPVLPPVSCFQSPLLLCVSVSFLFLFERLLKIFTPDRDRKGEMSTK